VVGIVAGAEQAGFLSREGYEDERVRGTRVLMREPVG